MAHMHIYINGAMHDNHIYFQSMRDNHMYRL
jgi:hypothetical protein